MYMYPVPLNCLYVANYQAHAEPTTVNCMVSHTDLQLGFIHICMSLTILSVNLSKCFTVISFTRSMSAMV